MRRLPDDYLWFTLGIEEYVGEPYEMRVMFDSSHDFSMYCKTNILLDETIKSNIKYDGEKIGMDAKVSYLVHQASKGNNGIKSVFKEFYPNINQGIFLWGAGYYGKIMIHLFIQNDIEIIGIIDNAPDKIGSFFENIPVFSSSEVNLDNRNVFIAISSDESVNEIKKQVNDTFWNTKVYSLIDLCMHPSISFTKEIL